jgi:hypothetical protein
MVRRHRIFEDELIHIIYACYRRFVLLTVNQNYDEETESLFRFLWRVAKHRKGNPHYPEINPCTQSELIRDLENQYLFDSYLDELMKN